MTILTLIIIIIIVYLLYNIKKKNNRINRIKKNKIELKKNIDKIKVRNNIIKQKQLTNPKEIILLKNLINDFDYNDNWINLIIVGNIYMKGSYPLYLPNKYKALECFKIAMISPDQKIAKLGYNKYIENKYINIISQDQKGIEIPVKYANIICQLAHNKIINNTIENNNTIEHNNTIDNNNTIEHNNTIDNNNTIENNNTETIINDLQNVHDHTVNKIIISNIKKLQELYQIDNINDIEIFNYIYINILEDDLLDTNKRYDIITVLNSCTNEIHEYFNISEIDSLKYIYKYIQDKPNKIDLYHILNIELYNCIENGYIVCSTGKIGRIISILDGIDNNFNLLKPNHIIRIEILNLSNQIREDILNTASDEEKNNYDNSIDNLLYNKMVNKLESEVENLYIKELNFNKEIINDIIEECKLGF